MDTLTSLRVFHKVVRLGSFTKAADELDMSVAMASKHIRHLEEAVGTKLLQRNSRHIHLTAVGGEYHKKTLLAIEMLDNAKQAAIFEQEQPSGSLRVSMPSWFATPKVVGWLKAYQDKYPSVMLELSVTNRKVDLVAEGFDLALRVSNDPKPTLIARPLAKIEFYFVASGDYVAQNGMPILPSEIINHNVVYSSYTKQDSFEFNHKPSNQLQVIKIDPSVHSDDTAMSHQLCLAGFGIACLPSWIVEDDLRAGRLVQLFSDYQVLTANLQAVYADRAYLSAKVRTMIDFLVEKCSL